MFVLGDHVVQRFRRLNETSCIVNAHVNPLSRTFLKNWNESCLEKSENHRLRFWTLELRCGTPCTMDDHAVQWFQWTNGWNAVLICIVNAHVNPLSRTFLKNWNIWSRSRSEPCGQLLPPTPFVAGPGVPPLRSAPKRYEMSLFK